jgi:hypothetical protein
MKRRTALAGVLSVAAVAATSINLIGAEAATVSKNINWNLSSDPALSRTRYAGMIQALREAARAETYQVVDGNTVHSTPSVVPDRRAPT